MGAFYAIESIRLMDYDGKKETCPLNAFVPLFQRTESRPPRFVEDKWLQICNRLYDHQWNNIKLIIRYL